MNLSQSMGVRTLNTNPWLAAHDTHNLQPGSSMSVPPRAMSAPDGILYREEAHKSSARMRARMSAMRLHMCRMLCIDASVSKSGSFCL